MCFRDLSMSVARELLFFFNSIKHLNFLFSDLDAMTHLVFTKYFSFQPKGADRKQKTDREKMEKRTPHEKEKYQPSYETTILTEVKRFLLVTISVSTFYS